MLTSFLEDKCIEPKFSIRTQFASSSQQDAFTVAAQYCPAVIPQPAQYQSSR